VRRHRRRAAGLFILFLIKLRHMSQSHEKLAKILRVEPQVLVDLEKKMIEICGHDSVVERIMGQNEARIDQTLLKFGLDRKSSAEDVYATLVGNLKELDAKLYDYLDQPKLGGMSENIGKLGEVALRLSHPSTGFFIKREKAVEMLEKFPPENILKFFGYQTVAELVKKEGFSSVFSALRFAQDQKWMHKFFDEAYSDLKADDFEERNVEIKVLDTKWLKVAEKFLEKKYHNLSHLKEFGVIFIIPLEIDTDGEMMRVFTLLLHYLNEVPFYSKLFRKYSHDADFPDKLKSLLRGDVPEDKNDDIGAKWRIVQRYLAKDDVDDFRLLEPHVNPEAEHWFKAAGNLSGLDFLGNWQDLDFVGDFFPSKGGGDLLVSFDLIDLVMSLVKKGEIKYLYHQEEALWNKIFLEYVGRDRMNELIEENLISGYINLK
jgi:hypothetical protein